MLTIKEGNLFEATTQTIVNPVNCVGVMGKGVALEFKKLYPDMYESYREICQRGFLKPGKLWIWRTPEKWILNFPTKMHWKYPSRKEWVMEGLEKFVKTYQEQKITSIAFPLLGTGYGGLDEEEVLEIMRKYLSKCDIPIEIWIKKG